MGLTGADYGTVDADENNEWDGLSLYTDQDNDPGGTWRAIFMANDNGGVGSPKWRTHTPLRMLTANQAAGNPKFCLYVDNSNSSFNLYNENVDWAWVAGGMRIAVPYWAFACPTLTVKIPLAEGAYLSAGMIPKAAFHVTTIFNTDAWSGGHIAGCTRFDKPDANGQPATPDRSRVAILHMEMSRHNPDEADAEACKWGNTQVVLHECGWAAGTTADAEQENWSVMDAKNDPYFYQKKRYVWGDKPELYWGHVNRMRAHLGFSHHINTPPEYR